MTEKVEVIKEVPTSSEPEIIKEKESVWIKMLFVLGGFLLVFLILFIINYTKTNSKENKVRRRLENE